MGISSVGQSARLLIWMPWVQVPHPQPIAAGNRELVSRYWKLSRLSRLKSYGINIRECATLKCRVLWKCNYVMGRVPRANHSQPKKCSIEQFKSSVLNCRYGRASVSFAVRVTPTRIGQWGGKVHEVYFRDHGLTNQTNNSYVVIV